MTHLEEKDWQDYITRRGNQLLKAKSERQALLDDFAKAAMQSVCVNAGRNGFTFGSIEEIACKSYDIATAMMQERERRMKG